ncbi:hypothetical protein Pmani_037285 [Petrolisthes manimaculis]|uniref:Uncharacterized protein n=1 Tax=Petrolisthes manimaculis TaxID=1843537 RepID=A0AAE1NH48_9EUCA|nr:hypothetical protein Pmani_037285 [Petrolisthes manimaculis]
MKGKEQESKDDDGVTQEGVGPLLTLLPSSSLSSLHHCNSPVKLIPVTRALLPTDTPSTRSSCHLHGPLSFALPVSPAQMSFTSARHLLPL